MILIVDNEPDITLTIRTVLEENGFRGVDVYNKPLLALQNFKSRVYCVLITVVAMTRIDGFELYKQIKKIDGRNNIVFGTASEVDNEALRAIDRHDISYDEDKAAILRGSREGEERIHFRKPVEINEHIQRVNKELKEECRINQHTHTIEAVQG